MRGSPKRTGHLSQMVGSAPDLGSRVAPVLCGTIGPIREPPLEHRRSTVTARPAPPCDGEEDIGAGQQFEEEDAMSNEQKLAERFPRMRDTYAPGIVTETEIQTTRGPPSGRLWNRSGCGRVAVCP